jgi:hypothetical protein
MEIKSYFDLILAEIDPGEMVHPKHADKIEEALIGVEKLGKTLKRANGQRIQRTTFGEWNRQTSFRSR